MNTRDRTSQQIYENGMRVRRAVLGEDHVDRATAAADHMTADYQDLITRYAWGDIWTRPGLDRRTRSVITITALVANGHYAELAIHLRMARNQGWTEDELSEALMHLCGYIGLPSVREALLTAKEVFHEMRNEK